MVSCTQSYDALGLPATRTAEDGTVTTVTGDYDYMGRRIFKKVEHTATNPETGESTTSVILNHRYLYRGHLQIAALDLTRTTLNALWYILWDPTEPVATRPLAIQTEGSWFVYGWDLTKNVMELYKSNGTIANSYSYAPFGEATQTGSITNPLQWSNEAYDAELGMVYYNFRFYNPREGRWISRDFLTTPNLVDFVFNSPISIIDVLGAWGSGTQGDPSSKELPGHSDLGSLSGFDYAKEDDGLTNPYIQPWRHFKHLAEAEKELLNATRSCDKNKFESYMHQMQDFYSHYANGYRWYLGGHILDGTKPDNPHKHSTAFQEAKNRTLMWEGNWLVCCCKNEKGDWIKNEKNKTQCERLEIPESAYPIKEEPPGPIQKLGERIGEATRTMPITTGKNLLITR